jgi:hypothetical protein
VHELKPGHAGRPQQSHRHLLYYTRLLQDPPVRFATNGKCSAAHSHIASRASQPLVADGSFACLTIDIVLCVDVVGGACDVGHFAVSSLCVRPESSLTAAEVALSTHIVFAQAALVSAGRTQCYEERPDQIAALRMPRRPPHPSPSPIPNPVRDVTTCRMHVVTRTGNQAKSWIHAYIHME